MRLQTERAGLTSLHARTHESGFTLLQVVVITAAIMIVCVLAVISIKAGRSSLQLSNSAQQFAEHVERARADSIRRRAPSGQEASVQVLNATTYRVKMGLGGSSTLSARDFTLEGDTIFTTGPITISFDSRGRPTPGTDTAFAFRDSSGSTQVDVTSAGVVSVVSEVFQDVTVSNSFATPFENRTVSSAATDERKI